MWNIKKTVSKGDYIYAVIFEHPDASEYGYVLEHRAVMENYLGRILDTNEVVHHINFNTRDNRIKNMELCLDTVHARYHHKTGRKMVKLKCPWCQTVFNTELRQCYIKKGTQYTCCCRSCNGKLNRYIQPHGRTHKVEQAISENLVSIID